MSQSNHSASLFLDKVITRYNVYNGLFLDLPYSREENIGVIIPMLHAHVSKGLEIEAHPVNIMNEFFSSHPQFNDDEARIEFMFKVIQFIERQVVLFDSVEDASFSDLTHTQDSMGIPEYIQMAANGGKINDIITKLKDFSVRLVFTAHPTQFYPPQVLDIISDLRSAIKQNDVADINRLLRQLGITSLLNSDKPTPIDEAKNIIYYLRHIYYDAVGEIFKALKSYTKDASFDNYNIIRLGFWPGGDRDGNPFVTHETTRQVADELRLTLMKCYYNELKQLQRKLTFKRTLKPAAKLKAALYEAMFDPDSNISAAQILGALGELKSLVDQEYHGIYTEDIEDFMNKVEIFQVHFATLDIRQDHEPHKKVVEAILKHYGLINEKITELKEETLKEILVHRQLKIKEFDYEDPIVLETIRTIRTIPDIQEKNGEQGCNRYIISNSEDIYSVLFVFALLRWCNDNKLPKIDIVPLFETMNGMDVSSRVMEELFQIDAYKNHVNNRGSKQVMMLGFSDGTKDGGYVKANWAIHQTKEQLTDVCEKHSIKPIFFDGRGGPPARGGGKTHRFYAAQGRSIANNEIQLTIQGQTITSIYGTPEQFKYNIDQMITAALANEFYGEKADIDKSSRALIDEMAECSYKKYTSLKNHPKFLGYLKNKSTLKYYGLAKIGSRPGKRGKSEDLTLQDLRAISFVGSWNQLKQNVPGYFGIGTALHEIKETGRMDDLKALFNEVKWFKALMLNSMMALSKSNFKLTAYMKDDEEYGEFWKILYDEYKLSTEMLLEISGYDKLMQEEIVSKQSIKMREHIVLPLLIIQQYALAQISNEHPKKEIYEKIVTRSLFGNINASRNSA